MASNNIRSTSAQPPDNTVIEIHTLCMLIVQTEHYQCGSLKDWLSREEQYHTPFYSNVMVHDCFFQILWFLRFENSNDPRNCDDPDYNGLQKIRQIFDTLNNFCEMYNPTEHLSVDKVIMLCKGKLIFRQYIPKKHNRYGIRIYKLCVSGLLLRHECVLGKQRQMPQLK